jgi:hypothetical protein
MAKGVKKCNNIWKGGLERIRSRGIFYSAIASCDWKVFGKIIANTVLVKITGHIFKLHIPRTQVRRHCSAQRFHAWTMAVFALHYTNA